MDIKKVNAHLHTPYSFSAFKSVEQALDMAVDEKVSVVGVNDFNTTKGYDAWAEGCAKRKLYPLFNIEFISLNETDQQLGLRVNDPGNPGRTYISGKGLRYPSHINGPFNTALDTIMQEANAYVKKLCLKLNNLLNEKNAGIQLDIEEILSKLTLGSLRERHLAKALRIQVFDFCKNNSTAIQAMFTNLFDGKGLKSSVEDQAGIENEIRANLLKKGGAAFVPEAPDAFRPMTEVCNIIIAAGGIPTYPFLADDNNGNYTDFEADLELAATKLSERGFSSVEFISTRNDLYLLEKYASYLHQQGFLVTIGTEHNTPAMEPIEPFARHGATLTPLLQTINYEGACVIAAHQQLTASGSVGYINDKGQAALQKRNEFIKMGDEIIKSKVNA